MIELSYRDDAGRPDRILLYRDNEPNLQLASASSDWTFGANGEVHKLVSDAYRIRLACGQPGDGAASISTPSLAGETDDGSIHPALIRSWLRDEERALLDQASAMARNHDVSGVTQYPNASEVESFFVEAINLLDGQIAVREPGRYQITQYPASLADVGGARDLRPQELSRCEYLTFSADKVDLPNRPPAELVDAGHPLLHATVRLVLDHYLQAMRQGSILMDPSDLSESARVLLLVEHAVAEVDTVAVGDRGADARQLEYVYVDGNAQVTLAGRTPYANFLFLADTQETAVRTLLNTELYAEDFEDKALEFAASDLVPRHLQHLRHHRKELSARAIAGVKNRVKERLKNIEPTPAKEVRGSAVLDVLDAQLQQYVEDLEGKTKLLPLAPAVVGGALILSAGLVARLDEDYSRGVRQVAPRAREAMGVGVGNPVEAAADSGGEGIPMPDDGMIEADTGPAPAAVLPPASVMPQAPDGACQGSCRVR